MIDITGGVITGAVGSLVFLFLVQKLNDRVRRCRYKWMDYIETAFNEFTRRESFLHGRDTGGWSDRAREAYNFDKIMMPMYALDAGWRMFFGMKWEHLLTGKQRFLAGIKEPEYIPHCSSFMFQRKQWKVWSHPGVYHEVRVTAIERFHDGDLYGYARYRGVTAPNGGNVTLLSKLLPAGMNPQRKKD